MNRFKNQGGNKFGNRKNSLLKFSQLCEIDKKCCISSSECKNDIENHIHKENEITSVDELCNLSIEIKPKIKTLNDFIKHN